MISIWELRMDWLDLTLLNTRRCFDVDSTSFERMDVRWTLKLLCAHWERIIKSLWI